MRSRQALPVLVATLALTAAPRMAVSKERVAVIFYTGETQGTLEPCGCTSDPLGDFARVSALVRKTNAGGGRALLVDAGNLSYPATESPAKRQPVDELRAGFLARELAKLPWGGSALGDSDLAHGLKGVVPKRLAANVPAGVATDAVAPSTLTEVGGIKIGVLGLAAPGTARALGTTLLDPETSARDEVERLRERGAEIVLLLAPVERAVARTLARASGADFVVAGKKVGLGMRRAERAGAGFVVAPGEALQYVGRLDIVLREGPRREKTAVFIDAGGEAATRDRVDEIDRVLARLDKDISGWQKDATADAEFVAGKVRERDELRTERKRLTGSRWRPPSSGSYFTNTLVPIRRTLPRDPVLKKSMRELDQAIGQANLRMAEPPPKPEPGRAFYVGGERCISCHKAAQKSWLTTAHAKAWKTLVDVGKEAHDDCVSCHVTGYGEVGGSSLGYTKNLENVQCEACHAPNSIHVEKKGKESPYAGVTKTPETMCVHCHNEKHSDTFQYEAYLRDALGPGHGEDLLDKLGPGPTARQLRKQAADRAARAAGERRKQPRP